MKGALIAVVALMGVTGLTGCALLTGLPGLSSSPGSTVPEGPGMGGHPAGGPHGPSGPTVLSGGGALTDNANDSYVAYGSFLVAGTESTVALPMPFGGTLSSLNVSVATAPGIGASWTFTVDRNGSATGLVCTLGRAATTCSDESLVTVVAGDKLDLDVTPFGTPALGTIAWSVTLTP